MSKFTVIGAGAWGTALALVLAKSSEKNQHDVFLYTQEQSHADEMERTRANFKYIPNVLFPKNIKISRDLDQDINHSDTVLIAVPSHAFRKVLIKIQKFLKPHHGVIWATKGLDPETGEFLNNTAQKILSHDHPLAVLTGPSFAKEVAAGQPTAVLIASNNLNFAKEMQEAFQDKYFRTYLCDDFIGAQIGGAVKNIMAIAVGLADGLGFGSNTKAALITRALAEMTRLGVALGAKRETLSGLSGLGDLILTCSDNQSRNRKFGYLLGQGKNIKQGLEEVAQIVEGYENCKTVFNLSTKLNIEMPIVSQMYEVLYQDLNPKEAVINLLTRSVGFE